MAAQTTFIPFSPKISAIDSPIPLLAPVTIATFPSTLENSLYSNPSF
jgi:hypothetical protein